ncbi:DUF4149 domain-containing protein [Aquincola sp. S2]|uniref:DUF4149 domain-containing protein n=1 Tax=Pseudaquabacterium terrae TaxID=2732868 RepID=A0ABX2EMS1_9BURK|nr:DUF4149 domain-containing protein [Aquabacterium terrae]NRF69951.1 DUF4149 domain-containing protein [Aquabacterium terrae]
MAERLRRLLPALWAGLLLCVALIATPAPFATLASTDAGRVVARIFVQEAWISLGVALLLLFIERRRARDAAEAGRGSVLSTEMLLLLGTLFCTIAGHFGIQPMLPAARSGQGALSFGQLHGLSVLFFGAKTVLVLALAWRISRPVPSS